MSLITFLKGILNIKDISITLKCFINNEKKCNYFDHNVINNRLTLFKYETIIVLLKIIFSKGMQKNKTFSIVWLIKHLSIYRKKHT